MEFLISIIRILCFRVFYKNEKLYLQTKIINLKRVFSETESALKGLGIA